MHIINLVIQFNKSINPRYQFGLRKILWFDKDKAVIC